MFNQNIWLKPYIDMTTKLRLRLNLRINFFKVDE